MKFKDAYRQWNETIVPDRTLTDRLLRKAAGRNRKQTHTLWYRTAAAVFLFCAAVSCSMPALIAHAGPVYEFLYFLSPKTAQYFMPVQMTSEDQGIRMEVVSAFVHDDTAEIYITMEDLESDRIDGSTDLFDSYSIHRPFDSVGTCERAGYDAATGRVAFLITLKERSQDWSEHPIQGDKITFSVREFLSHKATYEDLVIPLDLTQVPEEPATQKADLRGCGGDYEAYGIGDTADVLVPGASTNILPDGSIALTAWGYQNGMLHIQTRLGNTLEHDNHGYLWLEDSNGKRNSAYSISFQDETDPEHPVTYCEEVFDLSMEELADCTLHGYYVISGQRTEGNWKVTFPLE